MWEFLAGTGMFLIGMKIMEEAIMRGSLVSMKRMLQMFTNSRLKAVLSGTVLSAIAQSSTIVSVLTVAFVGAGVISLGSGVGVIIGGNVGSTFLGLIMG